MKRRWIMAVAIVVGVAVLLGGGFALAKAFESPEQAAARVAAPARSNVTSPVRTETLVQQVTQRVTIAQAGGLSSKLPIVDGGVVTARPLAQGGHINNGSVVIEQSGKPILAIRGAFALYRDISDGMQGPDVALVQQALRDAGISTGRDAKGVYGRATQGAVVSLFAKMGYKLPTQTVTDTAANGTTTEREVATLPAQQIMVVSSLPQDVHALPPVGATITDSNNTVDFTARGLTGIISLDPANAAGLAVGQRTMLSVDTNTVKTVPGQNNNGQNGNASATPSMSIPDQDQTPIPATITAVGDVNPTTNSLDITIEATPPNSIPESWSGYSVLGTITLQEFPAGTLTVPNIAVAVQDTTSGVVLVQAGAGFDQVPVTIIGTVNGRTAVQPKTAGSLKEGDKVLVNDTSGKPPAATDPGA